MSSLHALSCYLVIMMMIGSSRNRRIVVNLVGKRKYNSQVFNMKWREKRAKAYFFQGKNGQGRPGEKRKERERALCRQIKSPQFISACLLWGSVSRLARIPLFLFCFVS